MTVGTERRRAIGLVLLLLGGASLAFWAVAAHHRENTCAGGAQLGCTSPVATGGIPSGGVAQAKPATPAEAAKSVEAALAAWRTAVLEKDADTVVKLDAAFREAPGRFGDALAKSAKDDPNERVRAFSTRVLGKLKQIERAELFQRLLEDDSPYVRQNAAWALGELGTETGGRMATKHALADLRHVRAGDRAGDVRAAASGALEKLE